MYISTLRLVQHLWFLLLYIYIASTLPLLKVNVIARVEVRKSRRQVELTRNFGPFTGDKFSRELL